MTPSPLRRLRLAPLIALAIAALAGPAEAATPIVAPPTLYTFKLADDRGRTLSLLRPYFDAEVEQPGPYNRYVSGAYGRWAKDPWFPLSWENSPFVAEATDIGDHAPLDPSEATGPVARMSDGAPSWPALDPAALTPMRVEPISSAIGSPLLSAEAPTFWTTGPSFDSNGLDALWAPRAKPVVDWRCRRRPVLFIRHGSENDRFSLVRCDGAVEPGAVDRLSIIARPPDVPSPGELPDEPDPGAWEKDGEWLPRVKLVNPRLVWLLQKIADAFPHRAVYIYSGYRPHRDKAGQGHHSMHGDGRAMDIQVHGITNESLFQFCRKLNDVGCGYYPNSKFVHVDVRKPGTGHAFWIDISGPGEPSRYVDSWPGVVERGALAWMVVPQKDTSQVLRARDDRGAADVIRK